MKLKDAERLRRIENFYVFLCDKFCLDVSISIWGDDVGETLWLRYCAYTPDVLGWFMTLSDESKLDLLKYIEKNGNEER